MPLFEIDEEDFGAFMDSQMPQQTSEYVEAGQGETSPYYLVVEENTIESHSGGGSVQVCADGSRCCPEVGFIECPATSPNHPEFDSIREEIKALQF